MSEITPYAYDKESFAHHYIIVGYLEKGLEHVTDSEEFRRKVISLSVDKPESDIEYLYMVYDALGIFPLSEIYPVDDEITKEQKVQEVNEYLKDLCEHDVYLTELEKKIANKSKKPTKTIEERDFEVQTNEIACSIFGYSNALIVNNLPAFECIKDKTLNESNLFGAKTVKLIANVTDNGESVECITGYITQNTRGSVGPMVYYVSKKRPLTEYKQAIVKRLYEIYNCYGGLLTSSDAESVFHLENLLKKFKAGNLINCPKLCRAAKRQSGVHLDKKLKQDKDEICFSWNKITWMMRLSSRMSLYDYFSDVYFAGDVDSTQKRMVYGNLDNKKTLSVTISTGTFRTSDKYIDRISNMRNLKITDSGLKAGKNDVWNGFFGETSPIDKNRLNLLESNVAN